MKTRTVVVLTVALVGILVSSHANSAEKPKSQSLGDLSCAANEIARFNGTLWVCSADLTANEAATAAAQSTANSASTAAAAAQSTANSATSDAAAAQTTANTATAVAAAAQSIADSAQNRVGVIESQDLDNRVSSLEGAVGDPLLRTIIVSPVGPTNQDNGAELLAAVDDGVALNPTADSPVQIKIEPGVYDISGLSHIGLGDHMSLVGSGKNETIIRRSDTDGGIMVGFRSVGININIRDLTLENLRASSTLGLPSHRPATILVGTGGDLRELSNVKIVGVTTTLFAAVEMFSSATVNMFNVEVEGQKWLLYTNNSGNSVLRNVVSSREIRLASGDVANIRELTVGGLTANTGTINVANSEVVGPVAQPANTNCVFAYDSALTPLDASCQ